VTVQELVAIPDRKWHVLMALDIKCVGDLKVSDHRFRGVERAGNEGRLIEVLLPKEGRHFLACGEWVLEAYCKRKRTGC
jgi:hypothetical protein